MISRSFNTDSLKEWWSWEGTKSR